MNFKDHPLYPKSEQETEYHNFNLIIQKT